MLPVMVEPSPERGVFKWAWYRAARQRGTFLISSVIFSVVAVVVGAIIVPPAHASVLKRTLFALAGVGIATAAVGVITYIWALANALFQKRNELRRRLAVSTARNSELEAAPVTPEHAQLLRDIATTLNRSINEYEPPVYSSSGDADNSLLRAAILEHFPSLRIPLETLEGSSDALTALCSRLAEEAVTLGMDRHPWLNFREVINIISAVISARSMQRSQDFELEFHWREVDDEIYWGGNPTPIIYVDNPEDASERERTFERFVRESDTWPEATAIRENFERRQEAREQAIGILQVIANRDTITGRCRLCVVPSVA